jgi:hypothetical protein
MKASPDAGARDLVGKGRHVGPAVGDAGCRGAGHRNLGDICGSERRRDDTRDAAAEDGCCLPMMAASITSAGASRLWDHGTSTSY